MTDVRAKREQISDDLEKKTVRQYLMSHASPMSLYYGPVWGAKSQIAMSELISGLRVALNKDEVVVL